jgi:rhodanese-related sulfurtransferase
MNPLEAEALLRDGQVVVLDVRSPAEFQQRGHIPGALLLPVDFIACAPAAFDAAGPPLLVCCEHGIRSAAAADFLARAGFPRVFNMEGGMSCWGGARDFSPPDPGAFVGPAPWLLQNADLIPWGGRALDVACGKGRHALLLAGAGMRVRALDADADRIQHLSSTAARLGLPITAERFDLEAEGVDLGAAAFDLVLGFNYLHRPLFPALERALAPGGVLLYETFTRDQASRGKPTNPAYLLEPGELGRLVGGLAVARAREGEYEGRCVASIAALKNAG